uniref:Uncharacterized protein n=1 Tax=Octopus bimaculoides TaxID=37653 RepID=A0A0L8I4R6_OCTBM
MLQCNAIKVLIGVKLLETGTESAIRSPFAGSLIQLSLNSRTLFLHHKFKMANFDVDVISKCITNEKEMKLLHRGIKLLCLN